MRVKIVDTGCMIGVLLLSASAGASDVQPRLFTNIPVGTNFLSFSYSRSEGNVTVDPSVALDVTAELHTYSVAYGRAFGLWGKSATFIAGVPYADLTLSGIVENQFVMASDNKLADPRFVFAVNLIGAPAMSKEEFAGYRQKTIVGFNVAVTAPLGDYQPDRQVNFGSNRWSISPELGISHRQGRFTFEAAGSLIVFTDNDEYLVNNTLEQEPIALIRANVLYHFNRPGTWIGIGGLYLRGGETSVNGVDRHDLQKRSRVGAAISFPIGGAHNFQLKYSAGVTTRIGADFDNYSLTYTYMF